MVREGERGRGGRAEVSGVRGDGDDRGDNGITGERRGKEKSVEARRPGIWGGGVVGDVVEGVGVVGRVVEVELVLEGSPQVKEGGGRRRVSGGSGVGGRFSKVEVPHQEGVTGRIKRDKGSEEFGVEGEIAPSFQVDIEQLEGGAVAPD